MRRVVIDNDIDVDWINRGRHGEVLFEREALPSRDRAANLAA